MNKTNKFFAILTGFVIIASASFVSANHSWAGYHWARSANPLTLALGDNVSGAWDNTLALASSDWSISTILNTSIVAGGTNSTRGKNTPKNCVPTLGKVEVCNAKYGSNGWLGIASIWINGEHIIQGTVKMNDTYFNTAKYNTAAWRNMVLCQEVGHTFGLDHQDENFNNSPLGTCMDYTNDPTPNQHPNTHDYEELALIYSHLDSSALLAESTKGSSNIQIDNEDMRTWGKLVRESSDKRLAVYERDLGHANKIHTFVFWAE